MNNICKNCNTETTDLYCAHCGQSTLTKRIDWAFCAKEFIFNNLKLHNGLIFTLKTLILKPKQLVEDYLNGKRVNYTGAFHFLLFILIFKGIIALIMGGVRTAEPGNIMINGISANIDLKQYLKPMILIFTAVSSLGTYLIYKSRKYSLPEHFFISFYIMGMSFFLAEVYNIITLNKFPDDKIAIMALIIISYYIRIFYTKKIRFSDFIKGIGSMALNLIIALIILILGTLIYMYQHHLLHT